MKKMIFPTFFAFTPAYCSEDKVMMAGPVLGSAVEVACKGFYDFMKTALVATR